MLSLSSITDRLSSLGSDLWSVHFEARRRASLGEDILELTIGEPDLPTPVELLDIADSAMRSGRTKYSGGRGESAMLDALANKYSVRSGRDITPESIIAMPGTQAALAFALLSLVESGDSVLVPDPYYATYESVVRSGDAEFIPVPTTSDNGFHLTVSQLESSYRPDSKVLLLNSPHNPTGSVLSSDELRSIGEFCVEKDLWIVCDEVYEHLTYDGDFASLFDISDFSDRVIVVSSISKSHCAPGFRSGWCVGPASFISSLQPVAEAFLFGGQPFIADMTTHALTHNIDTADQLVSLYRHRISLLRDIFASCDCLTPLYPQAGMFILVDVSPTGLDGFTFANRLLSEHSVAVMPGSSFGSQSVDFIRLSLTVDDVRLTDAASRIVSFALSC